jgi:hypothetical protein
VSASIAVEQPFLEGPRFKTHDCADGGNAESQPDQRFWSCQAAREAIQASAQVKGNMAITFGLIGLTFAVCAVALNPGRSTPRPKRDSVETPGGGAGGR